MNHEKIKEFLYDIQREKDQDIIYSKILEFAAKELKEDQEDQEEIICKYNYHIASEKHKNCHPTSFVGLPKIINEELIIIETCYPLKDSFYFLRSTIGGWTKSDFALEVSKIYKEIYSKAKEHGIWGHGIEDLYLEGVKKSVQGGTLTYHLIMGS